LWKRGEPRGFLTAFITFPENGSKDLKTIKLLASFCGDIYIFQFFPKCKVTIKGSPHARLYEGKNETKKKTQTPNQVL